MKVSLDLRVFNWLLSVDIKKSRIAEYEKAAYHAWDRYRLYNQYYKDCKTEHQIALMTMLDISVHPFINYWSKICIEKFYSPTPDDTSEEKS